MDLYPPCTQRFLDVSEFTVVGDGEQFVSPLIRHLPTESHQVRPQWLDAHRHPIFAGILALTQEFDVDVDPLDDLELLTPFIDEDARTVSDREPSDFDLEPENVPIPITQSFGDSFENYNDMDNSSDMQDQTNPINIWNNHMDLLDAIEQHYELQHRQRQRESLSMMPTEPPCSKPDQEDIEDIAEAVDTTPAVTQGVLNPYEFLTFRESNIEFYHEGSSRYLSETREDKLERFLRKRRNRIWGKKISYFCRKQVADARLRVKGRFVTRFQANRLLGMDTSLLSNSEVKHMLECKFKEKEESETDCFSSARD